MKDRDDEEKKGIEEIGKGESEDSENGLNCVICESSIFFFFFFLFEMLTKNYTLVVVMLSVCVLGLNGWKNHT